MDKILWIVLVLAAGAVLPIQAGMNNKLAKFGESPMHASLISFLVGVGALLIYIMFTSQSLNIKGLKEVPPYAWLSGMLGAFYVTIIIFAFPKIGPALTFGLVVAGQLAISLIMEHFKIMDAHHQPINITRLLGVVLIIGGVLLIKK